MPILPQTYNRVNHNFAIFEIKNNNVEEDIECCPNLMDSLKKIGYGFNYILVAIFTMNNAK